MPSAGYLKDDHDKLIGRIAAFYNKKKAYLYKQPTGGAGFFECINDQKAANILFDAAKSWLDSTGHGSDGRAGQFW